MLLAGRNGVPHSSQGRSATVRHFRPRAVCIAARHSSEHVVRESPDTRREGMCFPQWTQERCRPFSSLALRAEQVLLQNRCSPFCPSAFFIAKAGRRTVVSH